MNIKTLKEVVAVFENSTVTAMEVESENIKIKLKKEINTISLQTVTEQVQPKQIKQQEKPVQEEKDYLRAPLVGTFYAAPSADSDPFVKEGSFVNEGDTVCIIEAMKVMNEIKAHRSGYVTEINVKNGEMVQYDQPVMAIGDTYDP